MTTTVNIFVNTVEKKDIPKGKISHAAVVDLAFPGGEPAKYKVTYSQNEHSASKDLPVGADVPVHEGMIFNVSATPFS